MSLISICVRRIRYKCSGMLRESNESEREVVQRDTLMDLFGRRKIDRIPNARVKVVWGEEWGA